EAWPAAKRARVSSYVGLGWQSGVLAAALVTPLLLPVIGWRGMFLIGIFPAIAVYFIRFKLDEPDVFVANKAQKTPGAFALRQLVADAGTIKTSLGMIVLCSVQNFGYYGIMIWLPNYLSTRFGYGLTQSALWTAVTIAGMALGIFVFGDVAGRHGRGVFPPGRSGRAVDRRRRDGFFRQRHARRLWRADERTLSHLRARHRAERVLQHRPRRRRFRSACGRRPQRVLRFCHRDRAAGVAVSRRHRGAVVAGAGTKGRGTGVSGRPSFEAIAGDRRMAPSDALQQCLHGWFARLSYLGRLALEPVAGGKRLVVRSEQMCRYRIIGYLHDDPLRGGALGEKSQRTVT